MICTEGGLVVDGRYGKLVIGENGSIRTKDGINVWLLDEPENYAEAIAKAIVYKGAHYDVSNRFAVAKLAVLEDLTIWGITMISQHASEGAGEMYDIYHGSVHILPLDHEYVSDCDEACASCSATRAPLAEHSGGNATCQERAICELCNAEYGELAQHSASVKWTTDEAYHYHTCTYRTEDGYCRERLDYAQHSDEDGNGKCDICDYATGSDPGDPDDPGDGPENNPEPSEGGDGLGAGAIVGIVIGSVAVLGGGGFALWWFVFRKKKSSK